MLWYEALLGRRQMRRLCPRWRNGRSGAVVQSTAAERGAWVCTLAVKLEEVVANVESWASTKPEIRGRSRHYDRRPEAIPRPCRTGTKVLRGTPAGMCVGGSPQIMLHHNHPSAKGNGIITTTPPLHRVLRANPRELSGVSSVVERRLKMFANERLVDLQGRLGGDISAIRLR